MARNNMMARRQAAGWPELRSGPLLTGGILAGVGAVLALAGAAVALSHVAGATRVWMNELEVPPDELARLKWEQAKTAAIAGADTWRKHPNAQARLVRRVPVSV
jgi:hypothetical protein